MSGHRLTKEQKENRQLTKPKSRVSYNNGLVADIFSIKQLREVMKGFDDVILVEEKQNFTCWRVIWDSSTRANLFTPRGSEFEVVLGWITGEEF